MAISAPAKELADSAFIDRYNRLFNTPDSATAFYDLSALRQEIAKRGQKIVRENHTFTHRVEKMLEYMEQQES